MLSEALFNEEDLLLLEGDTIPMGPYYVCYPTAAGGITPSSP